MTESYPHIRTVIVAHIRLYREGLAQLLDGTQELLVVGSAGDTHATLQLMRQCNPHVILLDMAMEESFATISAVNRQNPDTHIVAVGVAENDAEIVDCLERGVSAFVSRDASIEDLISVIQRAARGELQCTARLAGALRRRVNKLATEPRYRTEGRELTPRELQIAELIDQGMSNKEIARKLWIEVSTVKNHVHNMLNKLQVRRCGEAAALLRPVLTHRRGPSF